MKKNDLKKLFCNLEKVVFFHVLSWLLLCQ
jgi:hypothetical protein